MLLWALLSAAFPMAVVLIDGASRRQSGDDRASTVAFLLFLLLLAWSGLLKFGRTVFILNLWRGQPHSWADLFSGFTMLTQVVGAQFLAGLFQYLFFFASGMGVYLAAQLFGLGSDPALLLLVLPLLLAFSLRYALVEMVLADQPQLRALQAVQYSVDLMRGRKWKFFLLQLSFAGWALLCLLGSCVLFILLSLLLYPVYEIQGSLATAVILSVTCLPFFLWLIPWLTAATAAFYEAAALQPFPTGPADPPQDSSPEFSRH